MYLSIALMLLTFATGIAGIVAIVGTTAKVTITGGSGISAINSAYLVNLIAFCTLILAATGITFELRLELVLSRFPLMGTYWGRAGYYFGLALICFGLAGDLGIATAALLLFNAAGHIGLGFLARRQSSVY
eukprot:TRINITY_DN2391_c0_g1_i1.p1 TRINITY_DN2391_c0_g1~~TRINITY_DN2391_c0_g1_i1.p1  ORF type:complete len:131 (+),score=18.35 TRINITY_DN2391_c0_g1_i1:141-533(+)